VWTSGAASASSWLSCERSVPMTDWMCPLVSTSRAKFTVSCAWSVMHSPLQRQRDAGRHAVGGRLVGGGVDATGGPDLGRGFGPRGGQAALVVAPARGHLLERVTTAALPVGPRRLDLPQQTGQRAAQRRLHVVELRRDLCHHRGLRVCAGHLLGSPPSSRP